MSSKRKFFYVCPECGSKEIWGEAPYNLNTGEMGDPYMGTDIQCLNCETAFKEPCKVDAKTGECVEHGGTCEGGCKP